MKLENIRIVLVATTHPGNIGASCRAMKNMGLSNLYLVNPNLEPRQIAIDLASGATDVLDNAVIVPNLAAALHGCDLVFASSARPRDISLPGCNPRELGNLAFEYSDNSSIAIIFGREHAGLTNAELLQANYHVQIPAAPDYSSLNLSQSVQVICYELRMQILNPRINVQTHANSLADFTETQGFMQHLEKTLQKIDFLKPENEQRIVLKLQRLFKRCQLETLEINILRGILTQIEKSLAS